MLLCIFDVLRDNPSIDSRFNPGVFLTYDDKFTCASYGPYEKVIYVPNYELSLEELNEIRKRHDDLAKLTIELRNDEIRERYRRREKAMEEKAKEKKSK